MFDYLGTMSVTEFVELAVFAIDQKVDIPDRIDHLEAEIVRLRDFGDPALLEKLKKADKDREGVTHERWEPKHWKKRDVLHKVDPHPQDGGWTEHTKRVGPSSFDDADAGFLCDLIKNWMYGPIELKRERLEWKLKRTWDLIDQLEKEIKKLEIVDGELLDWISEIITMASRPWHQHHIFVPEPEKGPTEEFGMRKKKEEIYATGFDGNLDPI